MTPRRNATRADEHKKHEAGRDAPAPRNGE